MGTMKIEENKWLDTKAASEYIGYSESTLENLRLEGNKGPIFYKPLGKVLYLKSDLDDWVKKGFNE